MGNKILQGNLQLIGDETKTTFSLAVKGNVGSTDTYRWYPIAEFPVNDDNNAASLRLQGRIGGWTSDTTATINALVWNRGNPGMSVISFLGNGVQNASKYYDLCNLELYVNGTNLKEAATATLYIKCTGFFAFDLDLSFYQSTGNIITDKSYITNTPTGIFAASAQYSDFARLTHLNISADGGAIDLQPGQINFTNGASINGLTSYQLKLGITGYSPNPTNYYPGSLTFNHNVLGSSSSSHTGNYTNTLELADANITLKLPSKSGTIALVDDIKYKPTASLAGGNTADLTTAYLPLIKAAPTGDTEFIKLVSGNSSSLTTSSLKITLNGGPATIGDGTTGFNGILYNEDFDTLPSLIASKGSTGIAVNSDRVLTLCTQADYDNSNYQLNLLSDSLDIDGGDIYELPWDSNHSTQIIQTDTTLKENLWKHTVHFTDATNGENIFVSWIGNNDFEEGSLTDQIYTAGSQATAIQALWKHIYSGISNGTEFKNETTYRMDYEPKGGSEYYSIPVTGHFINGGVVYPIYYANIPFDPNGELWDASGNPTITYLDPSTGTLKSAISVSLKMGPVYCRSERLLI